MRSLTICTLLCLPALLLAAEFNFQSLLTNYANKHPNTEEDEPECEILNEEELEIGPLNAVVDRKKLWTKNTLNYELDDKYDDIQKAIIRAVLQEIQEETAVDGVDCVTFKETSAEWNRVSVEDCGRGCSSYVGMKGNKQRMCLGENCIRKSGKTIHEFLHALGFHHEHQRADRDEYVTINSDNIRSGMEYNFKKLVEGSSVDHLGTPYDYGSIMHYNAYAFAENGLEPTIVPKDPLALIGQRLGLSDIDIERIQILYSCKKAADTKYFKHLAGMY